MEPKISIITVCYNSEKYIEDAIKSVVLQSYKNKEYIIVDGGSTDNTPGIIERYRNLIDVIIAEPDRGISDAFNKGIKRASGEIVCIVNSDDMMAADALELFAKQYEDGIDVFRGSEIIRNFETGKEYVLNPTMTYKKLPFNFQVCHMATYIRRDAFERFGYYDVDFKCSMDRELLFRFHKQNAKEKRIDGIFGIFRLGGVSQNTYKSKIVEARRMMEKLDSSRLNTLIYTVYVATRVYLKRCIVSIKNKGI